MRTNLKAVLLTIVLFLLPIFINQIIKANGASHNYSDYSLSKLKDSVNGTLSIKKENSIDKDISSIKEKTLLDNIKELDDTIAGLTKDSGDYSDEELEKLKDYKIQKVTLQNQYDELVSQDTINKITSEHDLLTAKNDFQIQYYNAYLYTEQKKIAVATVEYNKQQLAVEKEKLKLGESTQNSVDLINNTLESSQNKIEELKNNIDTSKQNMLDLLEQFDESSKNYRPKFSINDKDVKKTYPDKLASLQDDFLSSNVDILTYNEEIKNLEKAVKCMKKIPDIKEDDYKTYTLQEKKIKIQLEVLSSQDKAKVSEKYYLYKTAQDDYLTACKKAGILDDSQDILDGKLNAGTISRLQYLSDSLSIKNDKYTIQQAKVKKANMLSELELISNGILPESSKSN